MDAGTHPRLPASTQQADASLVRYYDPLAFDLWNPRWNIDVRESNFARRHADKAKNHWRILANQGAKLQLQKKASARSPVFLTKQQLLKGAAYDPDLVWSPFSRSLAKAVFVIFYLGLTAFGTITLLCASIILDLGQTSAYYESIYTEATKCQHQDDRKSLDCELNAYKILLAGNYKIISVNHNLGWVYERLARFENCKENLSNALNSYSEAISYLERGIKPDGDLSTASSLDDLYLAPGYANERAGHLGKAAEDFADVCNKVITAQNCQAATRELGEIRRRIQESGHSEIEPQCEEK